MCIIMIILEEENKIERKWGENMGEVVEGRGRIGDDVIIVILYRNIKYKF